MTRLCVAVLCAVLGLSACGAPAHKTITPELQATVASGLRDGTLTLPDESLGSDFAYTLQNEKIIAAYRNKQWQQLAELVYQVGHAKDISYYYLGAAAENLGNPEAALKFYERAAVLTRDGLYHHHCREIQGQCGPVDLAQALPTRIQALKAKPTPSTGVVATPSAPAKAGAKPSTTTAQPAQPKGGAAASGQGDAAQLDELRAWEGKSSGAKFTVNGRQQSLFNVPQFRRALQQTLPPDLFKRVTGGWVEQPIMIRGNILLFNACLPHNCPAGVVTVYFDLKSGNAQAAFKGYDPVAKDVLFVWYSPGQKVTQMDSDDCDKATDDDSKLEIYNKYTVLK